MISKINNFILGDDGLTNLSSVLQTIQVAYAGKGSYNLINFGNSGVPGISAGSIIDVGGALFLTDADSQCVYRNIPGYEPLSNALDGAYYIVLSGGESESTLSIVPVGMITPVNNTTYPGWYEQGTINRILGGCTKSGSNYTRKWRYLYDGQGDLVITSDGIECSVADLNAFDSVTTHAYSKVYGTPASITGTPDGFGRIIYNTGLSDLVLTHPATISNVRIYAQCEQLSGVDQYGKPLPLVNAEIQLAFIRVIDGVEHLIRVGTARTIDQNLQYELTFPDGIAMLLPGTYKVCAYALPESQSGTSKYPKIGQLHFVISGVFGNRIGGY